MKNAPAALRPGGVLIRLCLPRAQEPGKRTGTFTTPDFEPIGSTSATHRAALSKPLPAALSLSTLQPDSLPASALHSRTTAAASRVLACLDRHEPIFSSKPALAELTMAKP